MMPIETVEIAGEYSIMELIYWLADSVIVIIRRYVFSWTSCQFDGESFVIAEFSSEKQTVDKLCFR